MGLLGLLLWFLLKDATQTTTPGCASCLASCSYVSTNGCVAGLESNSLPTTGACTMSAMMAACTQCSTAGCAPAPAPAPAGPTRTCVIWGDPHILTFDNKRVDFYTEGQYWIVKSAQVSVQGLYKPTHATSGLSVMKAIAFGGPFMRGNKIIIETQNAYFIPAGGVQQPIISGFPSNYDNADIHVHYDNVGQAMQK